MARGFHNEAFAIIHHRDRTIAPHMRYCREKGFFQPNGTNEDVQRRLRLVEELASGRPPPIDWMELARRSLVAIPMRASP
jgi:hypothetical protein